MPNLSFYYAACNGRTLTGMTVPAGVFINHNCMPFIIYFANYSIRRR